MQNYKEFKNIYMYCNNCRKIDAALNESDDEEEDDEEEDKEYCKYCHKYVASVDEWGCCDECWSTRKACKYCGKPAKHKCYHCDTPVCTKCRKVCPYCPSGNSICKDHWDAGGFECVIHYES